MAKDPAFLFYSSDFLSGVTDLTMEERGQYITLLCLQHQKGALSEKTIRLSVGSVSVDVLSKFEKDEDGNFYNKRLFSEIEKRAFFTQSRRNNGVKGGRPKKDKKPNGKPYAKPNGKPTKNHMGNENENEVITNSNTVVLSENTNKREKQKKIEPVTPLQKYIFENCPNISKLTNQLTQKESENLVSKFDKALIKDILEGMENKKDLTKRYTSVNLTIQRWIKLRKERENGNQEPQPPKADYSEQADYYRTQQSLGKVTTTGS